MAKKEYQMGVIGLGARAETFVRQLHQGRGRAKLFGVCDIDEDRMGKFLDYCEICDIRRFTDPEEFMNQAEMDAVIVTTPDFAHLDVARLAFKAGKHTYLDKPLDVTAERCREIIRLHHRSEVAAYVGFNLRVAQTRQKIKEVIDSGILGQIIHIEGLEQLSQAHSASFMRRFHRKKSQSGGLLNTKCCHDLDILQWYIGHEHKIRKVVSFGGVSIFDPKKAPAEFCHECPEDIHDKCPYKDQAGFVFPVGGELPIHKTREIHVYGGDLCVYNDEKELLDNQTVIMEWDNGVRGNFNLQLFQHNGKRETKIWGEKGLLTSGIGDSPVSVILSETGETINYSFQSRPGGHGGTDPLMIQRFMNCIESGSAGDSGLHAGLAATLIAEKALESVEKGAIIEIAPDEYDA